MTAREHACDAREFASRRRGMTHAMDGGLWLHRHTWKGRSMAHLVSTDRERLLAYGASIGMPPSRLQYRWPCAAMSELALVIKPTLP